MATDVILPALGMSQDSGKIVRWLKGEGDQVAQGEPLAEIETDKATVEIEAPATGSLARIVVAAGAEDPRQGTGSRRLDLDRCLVGLDLRQRLPLCDLISLAFEPAHDLPAVLRHTQRRKNNICRHHCPPRSMLLDRCVA